MNQRRFFMNRHAYPGFAFFSLAVLVLTSVFLWAPELRAQTVAKEPKKIALLVGINDYFDKDMPDLRFAENDVIVIDKQLSNLGFKTTLLVGRKATCENIRTALKRFIEQTKDLESDDIVLVIFSGHGQELPAVIEKKVFNGDQVQTVKRKETCPFFCARDAVPYDAKIHFIGGKTEDEIANEFRLIALNQLIGDFDDKSNSLRNLLIVDACRNDTSKGGKAANLSGSTINELPEGLSILFSAKSGQKSWESEDASIKHGVMSHFLIKGLQGEAIDDSGELTWGDLTNYVKKNVIRDQGKLAGAPDRTQNPHTINSSSDVIVLGRTAIPLLKIPFAKREIDAAVRAIGLTKGMKPVLKNDLGMEFRLIPAGTFQMGSSTNEQDHQDDEFQHEVQLTEPFYMGSFEVTQAQWVRVMGEGKNPSWFSKTGRGKDNVNGMNTDRFPVDTISWKDAQEFIDKLNDEFGVKGYRYSLPSEAQWEYACRAGSEDVFHFGDVLMGEKANCNGNYPYGTQKKGPYLDRTAEVGSYSPNAFGLYDMHGNVWEWCIDWYGEDYYDQSPVRDPKGPQDPASDSFRVLRGGSWRYNATNCRSADRTSVDPSLSSRGTGFRVVLLVR